MTIWSLQHAKTQLSDLIKKAQNQGPQHISVRGKPVVVIISEREYRSLTGQSISLVDFFRKSPLVGLDLDFSRDKS